MNISKLNIINIRGFEDTTLDFPLKPNRANILVAPNGFGKSSISTAFKSASSNHLKVSKNDKHQKMEENASSLRLEVDGTWLEANAQKNDISKIFDIHVIKSEIVPKAKLPKINGFTIAKPYNEIPEIDLGPAMSKVELQYDVKRFKTELGKNEKVVPNLKNKCSDNALRERIYRQSSNLKKLTQVKTSKFLREVIEYAANFKGTTQEISDAAEAKFANSLSLHPHLTDFFNTLENFDSKNRWLDKVLICHQLAELSDANLNNLKKWLKYGAYKHDLNSLKEFISDLTGAWVTPTIKEGKQRVSIQFPEADSLSNGQRDLFYFACSLQRAYKFTSKKPCIFIIDEVFDYLDDANLVVAQYFLSRLIEMYRNNGREIFLCLLTHLDPAFFKAYAFKKQETIYLNNAPQKITNTMRTVILKRDEEVWSTNLAKHFLHYHPSPCDLSLIFNDNFGLKKAHGKSHEFYIFLKEEWTKCSSGQMDYDPFAVCAFVRVAIERCAYSKLKSQAEQEMFLDIHGTKKKLEFAERTGINVPECCFLLGIIYNEALHKKGSIETSSTIALKLKNLSIQSMIKNAIEW
jgi:hypothetical protein